MELIFKFISMGEFSPSGEKVFELMNKAKDLAKIKADIEALVPNGAEISDEMFEKVKKLVEDYNNRVQVKAPEISPDENVTGRLRTITFKVSGKHHMIAIIEDEGSRIELV